MTSPSHEAVCVAKANIDHKAMRARVARVGSTGSRTGEWDVLAARGGLDVDVVREDELGESAPLLGSAGGASGGDDDINYTEFADRPWYQRPSVMWAIVPFSVLAMAYGGILAPRVNLMINLICQDYFNERDSITPGHTIRLPVILDGSNPQCNIPEVSSRASMFTLYGNLIAGLLSAFVSPKLGALSDRYGRTRLIAITSVGSIAGDVIFILAAQPGLISVNWILVAYALDGLCGSFTTAMALIHAYATDCVPPAKRNIAFASFHGCLFGGFAIGPILAGLLTKHTGTPVTSFYVLLGVHSFFIVYMLLICPDSLSKRRQMHAREKYRQHKGDHPTDWIETLREINLLAPLKVLWPTGPGTSSVLRRNLVCLATIDTLVFGVAMGSMTVVLIYVRQVFGWETYQASIMMTIANLSRVFGLVVILPILTKIVRRRQDPNKVQSGSSIFDLSIIRIAIVFDTLGYLGYTLATSGPMMITSGVVASLGGMASPVLQSSLTRHVPPEKTGQILGASGLLHALARVVAPTIFNGIFSATAASLPQTVFICLTATFAAAFACAWLVTPNVEVNSDIPDLPADDDEEDAA